MRIKGLLIISVLILISAKSDFLSEQLKFARVKMALHEKGNHVRQKLKVNNIAKNDFNLIIVAYKSEQILELYAASLNSNSYSLIESYKICSSSGTAGPKRRQGDNQVPEGFYYIDRFNPSSNFYLSLGVSYPNESDKIICKGVNPGGDIFIHGNCVTIGCIPVTDEKIKEIYLYAVYARNNGQLKIPVYIFPFRMNDKNYIYYSDKYKSNKGLIAFWENLKVGYDIFETKKNVLKYKINTSGAYVLQKL